MEGFEEHLELHRLDCLASHGDLTHYEVARRMREETPAEEIKPAPLVRGDDLIAQGYTPGPLFKKILQAVEDAQLELATTRCGLLRNSFPRAGFRIQDPGFRRWILSPECSL